MDATGTRRLSAPRKPAPKIVVGRRTTIAFSVLATPFTLVVLPPPRRGLYYMKLLPAGLLPKDFGLSPALCGSQVTTEVKAALRLNRLTTDGRINVSSERGWSRWGEVGSVEAAEAAVAWRAPSLTCGRS
jgi:hypothetical protein